MQLSGGRMKFEAALSAPCERMSGLRELPKNNLRILLALLLFYVVTTGT